MNKYLLLVVLLVICMAWLGLGSPQVQAQITDTPTPIATGSPSIISVQPPQVVGGNPVSLLIVGSGFQDGAVVILSNAGGLVTTFVSETLLRAELPANVAVGVYDLTVINPDSSTAVLTQAVRVLAPAVATNTPEPASSATPLPTPYLRPLLVVNSYGASSSPITPGQNLDFEMTLVNAGQARAHNIVVTFPTESFIPRDTGGVRALGSLGTGETSRFWQPLTASRDLAGQTIATMNVKVSYTDEIGTAYNESFTLTFPVVPVYNGAPTQTPTPTPTPTATATVGPLIRPQLIITHYESDSSPLYPGANFTLHIMVQNQGNTAAQDVTMILGGGTAGGGSASGTPAPDDGGGISGASGEFNRFAPVGSSNVQSLGNLAAMGYLTATQSLVVNSATEAGAYPIKVSFVYHDAQNVSFVDDQVITLLVYRPPVVKMDFYQPIGTLFMGQGNPLPLQLVNTGRYEATFGVFSVTAVNAFFENNSYPVGLLSPGGIFPLDAIAYPDQAGSLELVLQVEYTDDFNRAQVITQTITVNVEEMVFEPELLPVDLIPEPTPETWQQKLWRFILGLLGWNSSPSPTTDSEMPYQENMPQDVPEAEFGFPGG